MRLKNQPHLFIGKRTHKIEKKPFRFYMMLKAKSHFHRKSKFGTNISLKRREKKCQSKKKKHRTEQMKMIVGCVFSGSLYAINTKILTHFLYDY